MKIVQVGKKLGLPVYDCQWQHENKHYHRRIRAKTPADAVRQIAAISDAPEAVGADLTWGQALDLYLENRRVAGKEESSLADAERCVLRLAKSLPATVATTTHQQLAAALQAVASATSPANARKYRRNILAVANSLLSSGRLKSIDFGHVPSPEGRGAVRRAVRPDEIRQYLDALPPWVRTPCAFAVATAARVSAVVGLSVGDCRDGLVILREKRRKVRQIPSNPILDRLLAEAAAHRAAIGLPDAQGSPVFATKAGRRWERRSLLQRAQAAWKRAGLSPLTLHELARHSTATMAADAGWGADAIRALLGHDDRQSSARYAHPDEQTAAKVRASLPIVGFLLGDKAGNRAQVSASDDICGQVSCPKCGHKFLTGNGLPHKPSNDSQ